MRLYFRWSWCILAFALLFPIDLPAGGSANQEADHFQLEKENIYLASNECLLRASPSLQGHPLRNIPLGTPLRLLRRWQSIDGKIWFQVQTSSFDLLHSSIRGWVNV